MLGLGRVLTLKHKSFEVEPSSDTKSPKFLKISLAFFDFDELLSSPVLFRLALRKNVSDISLIVIIVESTFYT